MERRSPTLPICIASLVLLPVLYVFSIGPAFGLASRGYIRGDANAPATRIYMPLTMLRAQSETFRHAIDWYLVLWSPEFQGRLH